MKKFIKIIISFFMLISLFACGDSKDYKEAMEELDNVYSGYNRICEIVEEAYYDGGNLSYSDISDLYSTQTSVFTHLSRFWKVYGRMSDKGKEKFKEYLESRKTGFYEDIYNYIYNYEDPWWFEDLVKH